MKLRYFLIVVSILLIIVSCMLLFNSCGNKMLLDTTYKYKYAYVVWPDGTSECLELSSWMDYDGEQLQIKTTDGNVYLFSSLNCVLAVKKK